MYCWGFGMQIGGLAAYVHVASFSSVSLGSILLLPHVYPEITVPWWTLPLLGISVILSLACIAHSRRRSTPASSQNHLKEPATAQQQHEAPDSAMKNILNSCSSTSTSSSAFSYGCIPEQLSACEVSCSETSFLQSTPTSQSRKRLAELDTVTAAASLRMTSNHSNHLCADAGQTNPVAAPVGISRHISTMAKTRSQEESISGGGSASNIDAGQVSRLLDANTTPPSMNEVNHTILSDSASRAADKQFIAKPFQYKPYVSKVRRCCQYVRTDTCVSF